MATPTRSIPFLLLLLFISHRASAQEGNDLVRSGGRYSFAETYFSADLQWMGSGSTVIPDPQGGGFLSPRRLPSRLLPRLTIGGLHFWGHADFYVTFPIPPGGIPAIDDGLTSKRSTGIETGARLYPWHLAPGTVRPFVGAAWNVISYQQSHGPDPKQQGPEIIHHRGTLQGGVAWLGAPWIVEAGMGWMPERDVSYPVGREDRDAVRLSGATAWIGLKYVADATISAQGYDESGALARDERYLDSTGDLNGFTIAAGPSSAFTLGRSSYTRSERPYLDDRLASSVFPEFGLGYYLHRPDVAFNLAYRSITQQQEGYGTEQVLRRRALSLEGFVFMADYNGFVPFIGATVGHEWLRMRQEEENGDVVERDASMWRPGVIAGWDIRPTRLQSFLLRTNIRYTPRLRLVIDDGKDIAFDQLEFNFIQLVFYPGRFF